MKIFAVIIAALLAGCSEGIESIASGEVHFTSSSKIATRVTDDGATFEPGDKIGVSMQSGGTVLSSNVLYQSEAAVNGVIELCYTDPYINQITYPTTSEATFTAYYPYQEGATSGTVAIDVSDQSDLGAIDFISATSQWRGDKGEAVNFDFSHKLAKVQFNFTHNESVASLEGMSFEADNIQTIVEYNTDGSFASRDSNHSGAVSFTPIVATDGSRASVTAILHPNVDYILLFYITIADKRHSLIIRDSGALFEAGHIHQYNVVVGEESVRIEGESTILPWLGGTTSSDLENLEKI